MCRFSGPNVLVLTRSKAPRIPGLSSSNDVENDGHEKAPNGLQPVGGTKTALRGKSTASSLNCARLLSSLDWAKHGECLHITLSYWKRWPKNKDELADEKKALVRDLGRHLECGLWSLEYQVERHARTGDWVPHWHVLGWLAGRQAMEVEQWLRQWWAVFSHNSSPHGVKVTSGDQARGTWYLTMHAAKLAQSPPFAVGRWWGYVQRDLLLEAQDVHRTGEIFDRHRVWWTRLYKRATHCKVRHEKGFSWFLPLKWQTAAAAWIDDQILWERCVRHRAPAPF